MYTSSFSFNITCCLSRPFNRFIKNSLKCSRTNKKLFAKNFDFVREQFKKSSRTLFCVSYCTFLVFNNLSSLHSSTKYALRVRDNIYFRAPRNVLLCPTIYTFVKEKFFMQESNKKYGIKSYLKYAFDTILFYNKMLLSYSISSSYQSLISKNSMTSQP